MTAKQARVRARKIHRQKELRAKPKWIVEGARPAYRNSHELARVAKIREVARFMEEVMNSAEMWEIQKRFFAESIKFHAYGFSPTFKNWIA